MGVFGCVWREVRILIYGLLSYFTSDSDQVRGRLHALISAYFLDYLLIP